MPKTSGGNASDMKSANRLLVLRLICTRGPLSRSQIATITGLSRMATTNITTDLIAAGLLTDCEAGRPQGEGAGRKPQLLELAPNSPCVAGVFIGRRHCAVLITDLAARVVVQQTCDYPAELTDKLLLDMIVNLFYEVRKKSNRPLLGVGISAVGPLNASSGTLLRPPNFYGIRNLPLREQLSARLELPCTLIHDSSGGALAEKLYGAGRELDNFVYLQLQNGIGAGLVANGKLFDGELGLCGELGHVSIRFDGPRCTCGNSGCLELYANEASLAAEVNRLGALAGVPERAHLRFEDIVDAATHNSIAAAALEEYCDYVSFALLSCINLVDIHRVFVGYRGGEGGKLEQLLERKVNGRLLAGESRSIRIERSSFGSRAPMLGAVAAVAQQVFSGELSVLK